MKAALLTAKLQNQLAAMLHHDHIRAVEPLEAPLQWEMGKLEETFPNVV